MGVSHSLPSRRLAGGFCAGLIFVGAMGQGWSQSELIAVNDLSAFRDAGDSWRMVGGVSVELDGSPGFEVEGGAGVIANLPSDSVRGGNIVTGFEHGDIDLELEYMMAQGSNSGIYLQGRYEIQLLDSWGKAEPGFGDNGGIYERWDETRPEGEKEFGGIPPEQNASRAPGLWQTLKVSFRAPRFNEEGEKTENARIVRAELNGALIHDNVELTGPTRGAISQKESSRGPLRIQGDHGPVAFRNIRIVDYKDSRPDSGKGNRGNRILVNPERTPVLRSFVDIPGRSPVTHAMSVSSPGRVHYTYDLGRGAVVQVWRGEFLDATPMWHFRGGGSVRPLGAVRRLVDDPGLGVARLASPEEEWNADPTAAGFRSRGYRLDDRDRPTFTYEVYGSIIEEAVRVLDDGRGVRRELRGANLPVGLFVRLAEENSIKEIRDGLFLIGDHAYYVQVDDTEGAELRKMGGRWELIVPLREKVSYSILF